MSQINLDEIIAERELTYDKGKKTLLVKIGKPKLISAHDTDWVCTIQVGEKVKLVYGVDAFQALLLAMQFISFEINLLKKTYSDLCWLGMHDLGFNFSN